MPLQKLPVTGLDDLNHRKRHREITNSILDHSFDDSKVKTAAEIAAGVTPTNYAFPPCCIDRYGANDDPGTTDMSSAMQAACDVAQHGGGTITWTKPPYRLASKIKLDNDGSSFIYSINIRGNGTSADRYDFIIDHNDDAFDMTGQAHITWSDLSISTVATPLTVWLSARNTLGSSLAVAFYNVRFIGSATQCVLYNYGSEDGVYDTCIWFNNYTGAGASIVEITSNNIRGKTSRYMTSSPPGKSTIDHKFDKCQFYMNSTSGTADCFKFDQPRHIRIRDTWIAGTCRSYFYCDSTNGTADFLEISGLDGEAGLEPDYGIYVAAAGSAMTMTGLSVTESLMPNNIRMVYCGANVKLDNSRVEFVQEAANHGIQVVGTAQFCRFDIATALNIGTSSCNVLIGDPTGWTIGSTGSDTANDFWIDRRASHAWTYGTAGVAFTGASALDRAQLWANGQQVFFNIAWARATSIICAAGATITGLTWANGPDYSAVVLVVNVNTGVEIGRGMVTGTTITLPAINVGANVTVAISGHYNRTN